MLNVFKNKNFSFLFLGRLVSNAGDSLYAVAAMWLVYELGGSAFYTGLAGFLTLLPQSLQFLAGPFVDRWSLKWTLVVSQLIEFILIIIIPIFHFLDLLNVAVVLTVMPLATLVNQIAYPAQSAALPKILSKDELVKGNSAFSFAYQGVDLTFNALAGILVAAVGAVSLYIIDSITFLAAALLFLSLNIPQKKKQQKSKQKRPIKETMKAYVGEIKEGVSFIRGSLIEKIVFGSVVANFAIGATIAVLPVLGDTLGGSHIYGYYLAALSAGSLLGALTASWVEKFPLGKFAIISFLFGSCFWFVSSIVPWTAVSIALFGMAWIPIGMTNVIFAALMQSVVPDHLLGRVFSVLMSVNTVAMPVGSLIGGTMTELIGSQLVFGCTALGIAVVPIYWLFFNKDLRGLPIVKEIDAAYVGLEQFDTSQIDKDTSSKVNSLA
ncbi:MFS transporter [Radiobacillus sp. PE A8.2]|uniref:MFS transporter n=1 Tax=Radiobacillus sp. PE A8.2 TaxID=3380349 RepID=UPI00388E8BE7